MRGNIMRPSRIGEAVRRMRIARGLSREELGSKVGLSANRIQQYENNARKPKPELRKRLADALDVNLLALDDLSANSQVEVMHILFALEQVWGLTIGETVSNGIRRINLSVDASNPLYGYMWEWLFRQRTLQAELATAHSEEKKNKARADYLNWEWQFPQSLAAPIEKEAQLARLQAEIQELQKTCDLLEKEVTHNEKEST